METSSVVLVLRVAVSLAAVLGLLWWLARRTGARPAGRGGSLLRPRTTVQLAVVGRQSLGGRSSVALVAVGERRLLLGVSEHGVTLLTEVAPEPAEPREREHREALDAAELERLLEQPIASADDLAAAGSNVGTASTVSTGSTAGTTTPSAPAARKPAVPKQRNPLEGSILDATTWRQAVVAVQERTTRR